MPHLSTSTIDTDTPMGNTATNSQAPTAAAAAAAPTEQQHKKSHSEQHTQRCESVQKQVEEEEEEQDDDDDKSWIQTKQHKNRHHHHHTPLASPTAAASSAVVTPAISQPPTVPTKRHRVRSRSMPNLVFCDNSAKIHKPMKRHEFLNPKYLSTSSLPSASSSSSSSASSDSSISPLQPNPPSSSCSSSSGDVVAAAAAVAAAAPTTSSSTNNNNANRRRKHHHKRSSGGLNSSINSNSGAAASSSSNPSPPSTSCPTAPVQAPPVNSHSLREIDLQEIFKNPQLRHDIIFDPQLQFRPNLDGERGKRKRMIAERYWDSIVNEFQDLAADPKASTIELAPNSKLPLLFHTLRDILLSLLPVKDRSYVDSILDPDLLIQQIRHCALDFLSLAKWLAGVFKAHCAPMRDSWVDQMVSRIELGVQSRSPRRLVEGLRMVFAILEAMKLDVANHQIRTLRPMLVDTAIEFEQDYYTQIIEKGKTNLNDSLEWFKNGLSKFKEAGLNEGTDGNRSAFIWALLKLFSCSSDELVTEFPSTFGFDFSRLAGFRAELRKVVCLHLCVCLYQQTVNTEASSCAEKKSIALQALSAANIDKFKQDLLAIIEDSMGNSKWTKNTHVLALEISKRVDLAFGRKLAVPSSKLLDICSGWLAKHLQPKSDLYKMLENKTIVGLYQTLTKSVSVLSPLDSTSTCSTAMSPMASPVSKEIIALADRVMVLVRFHWGVFGKFYVAYVSLNGEENNNVETCGVLPTSLSLSPQLQESKREVTQVRQSSTNAC